jgi:hypothetical protein
MVTWSNTDNITTAFTTGAGNYSDTAIAEYLNFIVDQKEKVECELDVASEKMWKMKESFKHIEESKKKIQDKKCNWSYTSPTLLMTTRTRCTKRNVEDEENKNTCHRERNLLSICLWCNCDLSRDLQSLVF